MANRDTLFWNPCHFTHCIPLLHKHLFRVTTCNPRSWKEGQGLNHMTENAESYLNSCNNCQRRADVNANVYLLAILQTSEILLVTVEVIRTYKAKALTTSLIRSLAQQGNSYYLLCFVLISVTINVPRNQSLFKSLLLEVHSVQIEWLCSCWQRERIILFTRKLHDHL